MLKQGNWSVIIAMSGSSVFFLFDKNYFAFFNPGKIRELKVCGRKKLVDGIREKVFVEAKKELEKGLALP